MANLVYVDESGSSGRSWKRSPYLILVGAVIDEDQLLPLATSLREVAHAHLDWFSNDFEFHGNELWNGTGPWKRKTPTELLAAYEAAISLLDTHDIGIAHSTINRQKLHARYDGTADGNAYRLALQFLLEKIDLNTRGLCLVVADESKEQELRAIRMVADMQKWGGGEVPGRTLTRVIDCLHFVSSRNSPGVQIADLCAFLLGHRRIRRIESHPDAEQAIARLLDLIGRHTYTHRWEWP